MPVEALAVVDRIGFVDRPDLLNALEPLHVWTPETVLKRFQYRQPGLWVLGVRVYRRAQARSIRVTPEQTGCKTWVALESPISTAGVYRLLLDEAESALRLDQLARILHASR